MQQIRTTVLTTAGPYVGEWLDDPDDEVGTVTGFLEEHGIKATTKLDLVTAQGANFFNTDHVIAITIETRPAQ